MFELLTEIAIIAIDVTAVNVVGLILLPCQLIS